MYERVVMRYSNTKTMVTAMLKFKVICSVPEFVSGDVVCMFDAV